MSACGASPAPSAEAFPSRIYGTAAVFPSSAAAAAASSSRTPRASRPRSLRATNESYLHYEEENQYAFRDLELLGPRRPRPDRGGGTAFRPGARGGPKAPCPGRRLRHGRPARRVARFGLGTPGSRDSAAQARYGKASFGMPIRAGTLESAAFPDTSFDLVHASHLIEHLNTRRPSWTRPRACSRPAASSL